MTSFLNALPGAISQGLIWGVMAIGVYITYKILDIADLTVDGSICTGAAVCAVMILSGCPVWLSMLCAALSGVLAGLCTGLLHIALGIPALLSGILTQLMLWSVNLKILGQANRALPARGYAVLLSSMQIPHALLVLGIGVALLICLLYLFFGTELGCAIRATGANAAMSRAQGINTSLMKLTGLALSNGLVALCGAFLCQYQGYSDINMGRGAVIIGLAAVIIGETLLSKIAKNFAVRLLGVVLGAVIYYIVYQVVIFIGFDPDLLKMFSALVVVVFLGVPYVKERISQSYAVHKGEKKDA